MYSSGADIVWSHVPHSPPSICIHIYLLYCIESYRHIYHLLTATEERVGIGEGEGGKRNKNGSRQEDFF
jgi:hypothetical protein